MLSRVKGLWYTLTALTLGLAFLYLWFTIFPGAAAPEAWQHFSAEQVEGARAYSQGLRLSFIGSYLTQLCFLLWLVFSGRSLALSGWTCKLARASYWINLLLFFLLLWLILRLLHLPFTLFSSYYWQHHWGFATQTLGAWWLDYSKTAALDLVLSAGGILLLFWIIKRFPLRWWIYSAACLSILLAIQIFLSPLLITPLFNRFTPVQDQKVIKMVEEISDKAGIPVDQILLMDASRRTTKSNAYFAGLGRTKQIVLYDTLLYHHPQDEVKAVIAHEIAHWRQGHILQGLALYSIGIFLFCQVLFFVLKDMFPILTENPYPVHAWAIILLFFSLVAFISSPLQGYISQSMEKEADQVAVMLTNDRPAAVRLQINIAAKNASDVSPPPVIQWFSSHPSPLTRIELLQ
ncbi:MAG: M48 family metallopeptidase [Sporomusaceae bacterium]|nr:M48 family metallopeptidase [Sporomusaceae bacterium]